MAYFKIEPFGPHAEEIRFGILGSLLASIFGKKNTKAPDPRKFTYSMRPSPGVVVDKNLDKTLLKIFGDKAIPASSWSRKKKRRKG